ncbi:MAG: HEPN domain-containing protein [Planctomycetaceae bacterium]|jgi:HEPN domain-containing protein|nr:HEPN domain-containing protein [Planctomycetaceae bacterium]
MSDQNLVKQWFRIANSDLKIARRCLAEADDGVWVNTEPEIACFHCQQAVEKALKGFLVFYEIDPPKIHDLKVLCEMAIPYEPMFEQFLGVCSDIMLYAVRTRYPDDVFIIDDETANQAIVDAQTIFDFCKTRVNPVS